MTRKKERRLIFSYQNTNVILNCFRVAGFSLLHGYHPNPATPKLQHTSKQEHTTNVVMQ